MKSESSEGATHVQVPRASCKPIKRVLTCKGARAFFSLFFVPTLVLLWNDLLLAVKSWPAMTRKTALDVLRGGRRLLTTAEILKTDFYVFSLSCSLFYGDFSWESSSA
ncbi:hypothetical protein H6P81_012451 [Aristolochia fimbriata]|uniref:Uncharacterized protein n=1 Tax=Aristolochia fimbriata TaxID=158543 RepID=A0AAV7EC58_ARIFI|nr:hypothetical protein H6P81_012451 [Aristolochia fimbriata]